jgi:SIR2-like protein
VFSAVELLSERDGLEVSPFVAAWDPAVEAIDRRQGRLPAFFDKKLREAILGSTSPGKLITELIDGRGSAAPVGIYNGLLQAMSRSLRELVRIPDASRVGYLAPLLNLAAQQGVATIATLNYDLSVEMLAQLHGVAIDRGLEGWVDSGTWDWSSEGVRLLKLHGSIDWGYEQSPREEWGLPDRTARLVNELTDQSLDPVVLFGQRAKLRADGPFLDLLQRFVLDLDGASHLVVIGYSFRDDHVNAVIRRWLNADRERAISVVDPDIGNHRQNWDSFVSQLYSCLIPFGPGGQKFGPRFAPIPSRASEGLQSLASVNWSFEGRIRDAEAPQAP